MRIIRIIMQDAYWNFFQCAVHVLLEIWLQNYNQNWSLHWSLFLQFWYQTELKNDIRMSSLIIQIWTCSYFLSIQWWRCQLKDWQHNINQFYRLERNKLFMNKKNILFWHSANFMIRMLKRSCRLKQHNLNHWVN